MTLGPTPPALFVGRERERARIIEALAAATPMAAILGLAGAGKSALAAACAARWSGPVVEVAVAAIDEELRRLPGGQARALLLIDGVDRVPLAERADFLAVLARGLGRSRAILTSRERLPIAHGYDRFEIRLRGLRLGAARRLWQQLDDSYGKQAGFQVAWRASAGNPGMLRRAHAGGAAGDHPLLLVLGQLPPDQLALLSALAVARVPIPAAALDTLIDGGAGAALSALHRALLVDRDGAGACTADEPVRELLDQHLHAAEDAAALHARLPPVLARAGLDPVALARETTHHLGRACEWEQAADELAALARRLVEQGSSAELLHCLNELPPGAETPALAVWRVRCRLRLLELREGEAEARRALAHPRAHRRELLLLLARLLLLRGALGESEQVMAEAAAEPAVSARDEASLAMLAATVRCHRDQVPAAFADLDATAARLPEQASKLRATAAALRWLDHHGARPPDIAPAPTRGVGLRAAALLSVATSEIGGAPPALVLETDSALRLSEEKLRRHRDGLSRLHVAAVRAVRLWERGRRVEALAELERTAESARRLEYHVAALWLDVWTARALFGLGRCVAAEAVLAACTAHAERIGARWIVRAAASARAQDPVARLVTQIRRDDAAGDGGPPLRGGAHAMLAAAARGDRVRAETLGRTIDGALDRPGFGVERALAALARATLEHGSPDRAAEPARDELRADGGDLDLVDWLVTVTGDLILLAQAHTAPPAPPADQVVLDGETGELRAPSRTVPFARRHVLRRLLYCMARRAGEAVSKDDLAQAAWGVRYHPLRHDNALFVNIHRLRALLGGTGVTVVCWEAGYSLSAPSGFRFLAAE